MDGKLSAGIPDIMAGSAQWASYASTFADVIPPEISSVWPSALAVGAIHGEVAASHAEFGSRLAQTATNTQLAGISYSVMDVEQNAQALAEVVGDAVQS